MSVRIWAELRKGVNFTVEEVNTKFLKDVLGYSNLVFFDYKEEPECLKFSLPPETLKVVKNWKVSTLHSSYENLCFITKEPINELIHFSKLKVRSLTKERWKVEDIYYRSFLKERGHWNIHRLRLFYCRVLSAFNLLERYGINSIELLPEERIIMDHFKKDHRPFNFNVQSINEILDSIYERTSL